MTTITVSSDDDVTSTSFVRQRTRPGRQPLGFCEEHNLDHAWIAPDFAVTPGPTLRSCANCGKVQRLVPEQWVDEDDDHEERFNSLLQKAVTP